MLLGKRMSKNQELDWLGCPDVEAIPGKQGGVPLIKGTRIPVKQIVEEFELGCPLDEIVENYPSISRVRITALLDYAEKHSSQPVL
jgi:uncharacterized protein (DUF433 family)